MKKLVLLLTIFSFPLFAQEEETSETESFARSKELLVLYDKILRQSSQKSHFDGYAGFSGIVSDNSYGTLSLGVLYRPFISKYFLSNSLCTSYSLYGETKLLIESSLSEDAEKKINRIISGVREYRNRAWYKRVVLMAGTNAPVGFSDYSLREMNWHASAGYEVADNIFISAGSTLEENPHAVFSVSVAYFSGLWSAGYSISDRFERSFTNRHIYEHE